VIEKPKRRRRTVLLIKEELLAAALKLSRSDRAERASRLIEGLDDADGGDVEAAWIEEAERRYADYGAGRVTARDADEVFAEARRRLG
jgi:putative addiction module component (TIGR02574 family)